MTQQKLFDPEDIGPMEEEAKYGMFPPAQVVRKHKLLTKDLLARFAAQGRVEGGDPMVLAKFFFPTSTWTWYATEYDPETRTFFGLVDGHVAELGYFSLDELETTRCSLGFVAERDLYWTQKTMSQVRNSIGR